MSTQPEALRLADVLEALNDSKKLAVSSAHGQTLGAEAYRIALSGFSAGELLDAAAELRRLHALCGEWEKKAATWLASPQAAQRLDGYRELAQRLNAAEAVNQELLEALKAAYRHAVNHDESLPFDWAIHCEMLHSAIAKAEGQA